MAFRIGKPSQESFFALNAIPLYSYAIPLVLTGRGQGVGRSLPPEACLVRLRRQGEPHPRPSP
jgi:hypothetical protein